MIVTTLPILVRKLIGRDLHGQPKLGLAVRDRCAPVRLDFKTQNTTVRTDSAASHGHAHEGTSTVVILVNPQSHAAVVDSVLTIHDHKVRVVKVHPRHAVTGRLDHYQLECEAWG